MRLVGLSFVIPLSLPLLQPIKSKIIDIVSNTNTRGGGPLSGAKSWNDAVKIKIIPIVILPNSSSFLLDLPSFYLLRTIKDPTI